MEVIDLFEKFLDFLVNTVVESKEEFDGIEFTSYIRDIIYKLVSFRVKGIRLLNRNTYTMLQESINGTKTYTEKDLDDSDKNLKLFLDTLFIVKELSEIDYLMIMSVLSPNF